jgi:hypothetical protein
MLSHCCLAAVKAVTRQCRTTASAYEELTLDAAPLLAAGVRRTAQCGTTARDGGYVKLPSGCSAHPGYGAAATAPMIAGRTSTAGSPEAQRCATSRSASHLLRQ